MSSIRSRIHQVIVLSLATTVCWIASTASAAPGLICDAVAELHARTVCARRTLDQLRPIGVSSSELRNALATLDREIHVLSSLLEGPTTSHYKLDRIQRTRTTAGKGRQVVVRMLSSCPPHQEPGLKQLQAEMQSLDDSIVYLERLIETNAQFDRPALRTAASVGPSGSVIHRLEKKSWNQRH